MKNSLEGVAPLYGLPPPYAILNYSGLTRHEVRQRRVLSGECDRVNPCALCERGCGECTIVQLVGKCVWGYGGQGEWRVREVQFWNDSLGFTARLRSRL